MALYKRRTYKVEWLGVTKYGTKVKLTSHTNPAISFLAPADQVWLDQKDRFDLALAEIGDPLITDDDLCAECCQRLAVINAPDHTGMVAKVCHYCAQVSADQRCYDVEVYFDRDQMRKERYEKMRQQQSEQSDRT